MRSRSVLVVLAALSFVVAPACDKDKGAGAGEKQASEKKATASAEVEAEEEAKSEDEGDEIARTGVVELSALGVEAPLEGEAQVSDMMGSLMVQAGELTVTVEKGDERPKTGEEAQAAAADHNPVEPKLETLADGYVLTFTNSGALGTNYWVEARRELGGKVLWCTTTASAQAQQDAAVAFCKGLRPLAAG